MLETEVHEMTTTWTSDQLDRVGSARELRIAAERSDGTLGRETPIWVVCADDEVYVRTWYRRETGWYGRAVASGRARVDVPGLETYVSVEDLGREATTELLDRVDGAYRDKYGRGGGESGGVADMVSPDARATTLRLTPA